MKKKSIRLKGFEQIALKFACNRVERLILAAAGQKKKKRSVIEKSLKFSGVSGVSGVLRGFRTPRSAIHSKNRPPLEVNTAQHTKPKTVYTHRPSVNNDANIDCYASSVVDGVIRVINFHGINIIRESMDVRITPITIICKFLLENLPDYKIVVTDLIVNQVRAGTGVDELTITIEKGFVVVRFNIPIDFINDIDISELKPGCIGRTENDDECLTAFIDPDDIGSVHTIVLGMPGSGKTELLKLMMYVEMVINTPDKVRFIVMCTNKKFKCFDGSPYLLCPIPSNERDLLEVIDYTDQLYKYAKYNTDGGFGFNVIVINDELESSSSEHQSLYDLTDEIAQHGRNQNFYLKSGTQDYDKSLPGSGKYGNRFVGAAESKQDAYNNTGLAGSLVETYGGRGQFLNIRKSKWKVRFKAALLDESFIAKLQYSPTGKDVDFFQTDDFVFVKGAGVEDCKPVSDSAISIKKVSSKIHPDPKTVIVFASNPELSVRKAAEIGITRASHKSNKTFSKKLCDILEFYGINLTDLLSSNVNKVLEDYKNEGP